MKKKRILYIHQYFKTPNEPGGTRSYWISKKFIETGHKVIMLTSRNNMDKSRENILVDGIEVIYLNVDYNQRMGLIKRLISFSNFMLKSIRLVFSLRKEYDKIYATSTPLSVGIPAIIAKFFLNKPYIFEVRDLWPEVPIQMGALQNKFLIKILKKLEKTIYTHAESIVTLSPGMFDGVVSIGVSEEKVNLIPNMAKPNEFYPRNKDKSTINEFGIVEEQINIIYFGAIGKSNGLIEFLEKFKNINHDEFRLIIAGEGSEKLELEKYIRDQHITNVNLVGNYPMRKISELVNCCDVSLVSFANIPILYTNSPNKLFDSLSAGKPIIVNSAGWTKDLIEKYNCGFYYDPTNQKSFDSMMEKIKTEPKNLEHMGQNSRKLSESLYDRELLTSQVSKLL